MLGVTPLTPPPPVPADAPPVAPVPPPPPVVDTASPPVAWTTPVPADSRACVICAMLICSVFCAGVPDEPPIVAVPLGVVASVSVVAWAVDEADDVDPASAEAAAATAAAERCSCWTS